MWFEVSFIHFIQPIELEFHFLLIHSLFIHSNYVPWVLLFCCIVPVFGDLILIVSDLFLIVVGLFWTCLKKINNHLREFYFSWSMHIGSMSTIQWKKIHRWNHSLWRSLLLWVSFSIFFSVLLLMTIVQHNLLTSFLYWTFVLDVQAFSSSWLIVAVC